MAEEDFTGSVDIDAFARTFTTPAFDTAAVADAYRRHFAGEYARLDLEAIGKAFKASWADDPEYKPKLIPLMSCLHEGQYSDEKVWRVMNGLGEVGDSGLGFWNTTISALAEIAQQLTPHSADPDAMIRDVMSWVELGDAEALARIAPAVRAAGRLTLRNFGRSQEVGARLCDLLALGADGVDAKLEVLLTHAEGVVSKTDVLAPLALWLERHVGPRTVPPMSIPATNESDRQRALATYTSFYRLAHDHRAHFDARAAPLLADFVWRTREMLHALGIIDEELTIERAGKSGKPWRILRAGRVLFVSSGAFIDTLPRLSVAVHPTEAKARTDYGKRIAAKQKDR